MLGPCLTAQFITNEHESAKWVKMRSITEQGAIDEFIATAKLAGTDFTAQRQNSVQIIHTSGHNPYLLSDAEERAALQRHVEHQGRLAVPRRPRWDASTTPAQLDQMEREAFLVWRRGLAELQDNQDLLMTPFERNIEVWRQLWRVIERSDLLVQIVDARNPLLFRSADLDAYVKEVDPAKQTLLLVNKADMMTTRQRRAWARYLTDAGIAYKFFSAYLANEQNELRDQAEAAGEATPAPEAPEPSRAEADSDGLDTRILTVDELEALFLQYAPQKPASDATDEAADSRPSGMEVGLVGYPNVGKSSTINALIGAKKVSVSATPGKTKHFQTIRLSERVVLCDCPGLVFPNFATTKADLVCNGILPIDQLREFTGPAALVTSRIPKAFLEAVYGIRIRPLRRDDLRRAPSSTPTAEELLTAYARARGFTKSGQGMPDESRAARYILKDYVNGKLLFVAPPPDLSVDPLAFNAELYDAAHLPEKRRLLMAAAEAMDEKPEEVRAAAAAKAPEAHVSLQSLTLEKANEWELEEDEEDSEEDSDATESDEDDEDGKPSGEEAELEEDEEDEEDGDGERPGTVPLTTNATLLDSAAAREVDREFFRSQRVSLVKDGQGTGDQAVLPPSRKYTAHSQGATKSLSGRKARLMGAMAQGLTVEEARRAAMAGAGKKHFKGGARGKGKKKTPSNAADEY